MDTLRTTIGGMGKTPKRSSACKQIVAITMPKSYDGSRSIAS